MNTVIGEVRLTRAGGGALSTDAFQVSQRPVAGLAPDELLVRVHYVSLDPYQWVRLRQLDAGAVPPAGAVGQVVASRDDSLPEGTWVVGELGWVDHAVVTAERVTAVERYPDVPLYHHVGLLGLSGITAYLGMTRVARPQPGERVVVSGAYGGVGQVALQIAALTGSECLGLVGSAEKHKALADLGLPALNYRDEDWVAELARWAPDGVDVFFDNVWGPTAARVVEHLRPLGRVALCGQISGLESGRVPPLDIDWYLLVTRSLTMQGFRAVDYLDSYAEARAQLAQWYARGEVRQDVNLVDGLDRAGDVFVDLMHGRTFGKTIVQTAALPGAGEH